MPETDEEALPGWGEDSEPTAEETLQTHNVLRCTRWILLCCAIALLLAFLRTGHVGQESKSSSTSFSILVDYSAEETLGEAKLVDDAATARLEHDTVVIFKAFVLTKSKLDRLFRHLLYVLDRTTSYHFCVLLDNTNRLAESMKIEADPRFSNVDQSRFHMFNYTLYDVIGEFPEMIYYLYQREYKQVDSGVKVRGSCCGRNDMWQMLRAPILLWQIKKSLRFRYTWMIEDDFEAFQAGEQSLMPFIIDLDKKYKDKNADVLGFRQVPCPTFWHKVRRTPKFVQLLQRNEAKKLPWFCVADYAQRLSQNYLREHETALRRFVFGFGETMVYPLALDKGLSVELYDGFEWIGFRKKPIDYFYNISLETPDKVILAHIKE